MSSLASKFRAMEMSQDRAAIVKKNYEENLTKVSSL